MLYYTHRQKWKVSNQTLQQPPAHYRLELSFQASGISNFETDNNYLGPGLDSWPYGGWFNCSNLHSRIAACETLDLFFEFNILTFHFCLWKTKQKVRAKKASVYWRAVYKPSLVYAIVFFFCSANTIRGFSFSNFTCNMYLSDCFINCIVFNALFNIASVKSQWPVHLSMLHGIYLTSTTSYILSKPLAAFPFGLLITMVSSEKGVNPAAMTIINIKKENGQAGNQTSNLLLSSSDRATCTGHINRMAQLLKSELLTLFSSKAEIQYLYSPWILRKCAKITEHRNPSDSK